MAQPRLNKAPRLRLILVIPFLLQICLAVGLTGWLSFRNGQKAVNELSERLMIEVSDRIDQHLDQYLATPVQVNQANLDAIELGILKLQDFAALKRYFWKQLKLYPDIGYISYAAQDGSYIGAGRWLEGKGITIDEKTVATGRVMYTYDTNAQGRQGKLLLKDNMYNPLKEPWYLQAVQTKRTNWAPIVPEVGEFPYISASVNSPVYNRQHELLGVIGVDLILYRVSEFLHKLKVSPSSQIFILESNGLLVASSGDEKPFKVLNQQKVERLTAFQSAQPSIRSSAHYLQQRFGQFKEIDHAQSLRFSDKGQPQFLRVTPWKDALGLNWLVVVVIPESDFMGQINENTQTTLLLCMGSLIIAAGFGFYTSRWVTKPILQLSKASQSITQGNLGQTVAVSQIRELNILSTSFNTMAEQLRDSFSQLSHYAHHDSLTGLLNRFAFRQLLQEQIVQQRTTLLDITDEQTESPCIALLFLDLDYFKLINDSLGHLAGDQLLIQVSERLKTCLRNSDMLARFGGDEFVILLNSIEHIQNATEVAQRIIEALQNPFFLGDCEVYTGVSMGIAFGTFADQTPDSLLRNADSALYQAKVKGKGIYEVFDTEMHTNAVKRLQLENDLRRAIDREELRLYYQPIINLQTHQISGYEALVRWFHPTVGMISPGDFIPVAEETDLIVKLGWWILRQACLQMKEWRQAFPSQQACTISVNISSKQFLLPNLIQQVQDLLTETQLPPQMLKLEITESLLMQYHQSTLAKLEALTALGIQLSIDDFGTGYSSLSYLHRFPVSTLKIDRSFITLLETSSEQLAIVRAIIQMTHQMGMDVVAEGVERSEQLTLLQQLGCDAAQGFLFSRPLPATEIPTLMEQLVQPLEPIV